MFGLLKRAKSKREIIINAENLETRVGILESGKLEELQVEHPTEERMVGSIYKGRIQNLEHDLQAAFVDIGMKKNAFLHYWDMNPEDAARRELERGSRRRGRGRSGGRSKRERYTNEEIASRFPPGSEIVVQVTKGPIGTKGPRVTASLSIPGRYLVLMPGSKLKGVSRKIDDDRERQRLKKMVTQLEIPKAVGVIVRTVGEGAKKNNFNADMAALLAIWEDLQQAINDKPAPCCVYQEPDLSERVVRDWLTQDVDRIIIDSEEHYERIRDVASRISRKARSKINLYQGDLPVFDHYDVEGQIEDALRRRVNLKSGGYIVFDETEALIAIDVNTGRFKGKGSQDEAILAVNTEAVEEVARQLRLRNVGGLVVIDLIDMKSRKHQNAVYRVMREALSRDRARVNVLAISELGIMEMTRQRVEESIHSSMYVDCPYCRGRGCVKSPLGMSVEVQRQLAAIMRRKRQKDASLDLEVTVHPTVLDRMRREDEAFLVEMESKFTGRLTFHSDPGRHMEFFQIRDTGTDEILYSSSDK